MRRQAPPAVLTRIALAAWCVAAACGQEAPGSGTDGFGTDGSGTDGSRARAGSAAGSARASDQARPGDAAGPPDSIRVVDAAGREWVLPRPARRVVSLVPSASASLHAMGAEWVLVGRTDFDTDAWAAGLPSVGGGIEPNLEAIAALEPDVVVRFAGPQDPRTPARLDELGIPHVAVRPDRIADIYTTNAVLGRVTGHEREADSLNATIRAGLRKLTGATRGLRPVRVAFVLGGSPPWVAGPGTYIDEVIRLVGGVNVFADLDALYAAVSPEELRTRRIDVVIVSRRGAYDTSLTPGARVEEVGDALELPGPGVVEAARRVAELLHGDLPDADASG